MKPALSFALFLCLSGIAAAQAGTGAELRNSGTDYVRVCGPSVQGQTGQYTGVCNVWLTGVVDGLQAYNANMKSIPLFDAPDVTVGQVAKLMVNYVAAHPDRAQYPASALVLGALMEAFPHKQGSNPPKQ